MLNMSEPLDNVASQRSLTVIIKVCVVIPSFCVFLFCIVIMLHIFASHRHFLDSSRYILFAYMLINDTLQLLSSVLLFLFVMTRVNLAIVYCFPLLFFSVATFQNTPFILAAMSLERYVAICYPLRRPAAWRPDRIWVIVLALWLLSCVLPVVDFAIFRPAPGVDALSTPVLCKSQVLNASPVQIMFKVVLNGLYLAVVTAIILFTYVRILLETRRMRRDRASGSKAMNTVLLHGVQLLLCVMAFTYPVTENVIRVRVGWLREHISFFNYFCFILAPRLLSPLIYGLRDDSLRAHMRTVLCCSHRVGPRTKAGAKSGGR